MKQSDVALVQSQRMNQSLEGSRGMNSQDIRARIAELEVEAAQQADASSSNHEDDRDEMSWESLFGAFGDTGSDDFALNDWLAEGLRGLRASLRSMGVNDEFWGHIRAAEREVLLAARVLIDTRLERLERSSRGNEATDRLQNIDIEF